MSEKVKTLPSPGQGDRSDLGDGKSLLDHARWAPKARGLSPECRAVKIAANGDLVIAKKPDKRGKN